MVWKVLGATLLCTLLAAAQLQLRSGITAVQVLPGWEVGAPATVVNTGTAPLRLIVQMDPTQMPQGALPYFCWGPSCYAPGVLVSPDTVTLAPDAEEHSFKAYVYIEAGSAAASAPLVFRFRNAETGAEVLTHTVWVRISEPTADPVQLVWAQVGIAAPAGSELASLAALYNGGTQERRLLVRLEPIGLPTDAVRFCLGDSCYGSGVLTAPDTLVLSPRHFYPRLTCWMRIAEAANASVRVHITDAATGQPVADYLISPAISTAVAAEPVLPTVPPRLLVAPSRLILPAGTALELWSLTGQQLLRIPAAAREQDISLPALAPGLYLYRFLRGTGVVHTGAFLQPN
jgi:hypothetical protein